MNTKLNREFFFKALVLMLLILSGCADLSYFQQQPEITGVTIDKKTCSPGETIYITVATANIEDEQSQLQWLCSRGSLDSPAGNTNAWTAPAELGEATIRIIANGVYHDFMDDYEITINVVSELLGSPNLYITTDGNGTTMPGDALTITYGTSLYISATPNQGFVFSRWVIEEGEHVVIRNPEENFTSITLTQGTARLRAIFTAINEVVKRDIFLYNTTESGAGIIHMRTNIRKHSNIMYRFLAEGYSYHMKAVINSDICGYSYRGYDYVINSSSNNYAAGAVIGQYYSDDRDGDDSDEHVVITLEFTNTYFIGFALSVWVTNPTGYGFNVEITDYWRQVP